MKLQLFIEMENASFFNDAGHVILSEAKIILRALINKMPELAIPEQEWILRDVNGNKVGKAEVIE